jgi:hypothetical protein
MQFPDRFTCNQERRRSLAPAAPLSCDRGGPVHRMDEILAELIDQYRTRFPELRLAVVQTATEVW